MLDFSFGHEERAIRDTAREFIAKEVISLESEVLRRERNGQPGLPADELRDLQLKAKRFGFWGPSTPEQYGGMDLSAIMQSTIATERGRTFVPFKFGGEADNILYHANDEQRLEFLLPTIAGDRKSCFAITEPGAGSDLSRIKTIARPDGDDWLLNGEKTFITGGSEADFAIVFAVTSRDASAGPVTTAFLVDRSMGWTSQPIQTMGQNGPAALVFADVRVPARNVLGRVGDGIGLAKKWITKGRYIIPSLAVGMAERLLEMAIAYANTRETFGKPIGENQAIQWMIADAEVELEACRWLTLHAAWMIDQNREAKHATSIAKLFGAGMANDVVDKVLQIHGGMGYTREMPIERWYREARLWRIFEGTDEIQRMIISRDLLRGHTRVGGHLT
jgi:acyl-CoA dehydrogenase